MPPVYAVISFASYRFFREYTYYSLIETVYEAIGLSAFLLLLIEYVAATAIGGSAERALERKDKAPLPIPFCCWRYRPTKPYFLYTVKWSVLQYVIIRPVASIVGIICERFGVLCSQAGFSPHWANVYLECITFISISIALYGLLLFYGLTSDELKGRRPMAKFLAIKLIVMFTFYQSFVFSALENKVIFATSYWTATNVADGLSALAICIEMVFFSILMWWAYSFKEYHREDARPVTGIWKPLWDSINYADFVVEIASSFRYYWSAARHRHSSSPPSHPPPPRKRGTMVQVFGGGSATAAVVDHDHDDPSGDGGERTSLSISGPGVFSTTTPGLLLRSLSPGGPLVSSPSPSAAAAAAASTSEEEECIPLTKMDSASVGLLSESHYHHQSHQVC